jgi:hypothetical protein
MEQRRQLTDTSGKSFTIISFILKWGEPFTVLDFFRTFSSRNWLPTSGHLAPILHILKQNHLELAIGMESGRLRILNVVVDG